MDVAAMERVVNRMILAVARLAYIAGRFLGDEAQAAGIRPVERCHGPRDVPACKVRVGSQRVQIGRNAAKARMPLPRNALGANVVRAQRTGRTNLHCARVRFKSILNNLKYFKVF
jgi:hypothetical protein